MNKFKKQHSLENRKEESTRILEKYNNRIPLIVLKDKSSKLPDLDRYKFLAPHDITLGQFITYSNFCDSLLANGSSKAKIAKSFLF